MRKNPGEVANEIFERINKRFKKSEECFTFTPSPFPAHGNTAFKIDKGSLRELSGRKTIRRGFCEQVKSCLDPCGYAVQVDKDGIRVTPEPQQVVDINSNDEEID